MFQELGSLLSMHGFKGIDDFGGLKECHLNELNITDPEKRSKILREVALLKECKFTSGSYTQACYTWRLYNSNYGHGSPVSH